MPMYTVEQGDCMNSIAKAYGFLWQTLWNHPLNASVKQKRKDPNVLYPGDVVHVPEKEPKFETGETDQRHRFKLKGNVCKLRIRLLYNDKPRTGEPYHINIDGTWFDGQTDGDGWLEQVISPDAQKGKLVLPNASEEHSLLLGHMDPITEIAGIQK